MTLQRRPSLEQALLIAGLALLFVTVARSIRAVAPAYAREGAVHGFPHSDFPESCSIGPARVCRAGAALFEPSGSTKLASENASTAEPAIYLAVFVAQDGANLASAAP